MSWRVSLRTTMIGGLLISGLTGPAVAGDNRAKVLTRRSTLTPQVKSHPLNTNGSGMVTVTTRRVVSPAAVVSRELSDQPVHPHLIEVQVAHTTIYLDPQIDYRHQHRLGTMTENTYIKAALERHHRLTRGRSRAIYGSTRIHERQAFYPNMVRLPIPNLGNPTPNVEPRSGPKPYVPKKALQPLRRFVKGTPDPESITDN